MKRFYKELILGLIGVLLLNLIIYKLIIYPEVYKPYEEVLEQTIHNKVIFSDSHGWSLTHNNPEGKELLDNHGITNLSYGSESYFDIFFKLKYLLEKDISVDTIFLSADLHMLGKLREKSYNKSRSIKYVGYKTYNDFYPMTQGEFFFRKYIRRFISTFDTNNSKLIQRYLESLISSKQETELIKWEFLNHSEKQQKSIERFQTFYEKGFSKKLENALSKIYELCERNNITIILVKFPLAPSMEKLKIPIEFINNDSIITKTKYKQLNIHKMGDEYFANQDHVNAKGAKLVIKQFINLNN
jgi:hypothetical protein